MKVLFVCTGNSCRSPLAEAVFRQRVARAGLGASITVSSAGTAAMVGQPPQPQVLEVLRRQGLSLPGFRGTQVSAALLREADWIVCMSPRHRAAVLRLAPELAERLLLAAELAGTGMDIPDPYGGTVADYQACYDTLEVAAARLLELVQATPQRSPR